ncbi:hypothetical protein GDO81_004673 [Engystomops pustulosus]|uniref:Secreted protein n=1 Tax=Engystomops pustulosus TaxID=76066 RepID=A0AAV7CHN5_ENGPU|nr:hypothetical protein GDO81_004673 [Engystomops pustulosus]
MCPGCCQLSGLQLLWVLVMMTFIVRVASYCSTSIMNRALCQLSVLWYYECCFFFVSYQSYNSIFSYHQSWLM